MIHTQVTSPVTGYAPNANDDAVEADAGSTGSDLDNADAPPDPASPHSDSLARLAAQNGFHVGTYPAANSPSASAGDAAAAAPLTTAPTDPRFAAVNDALQAGKGSEAIDAAKALLAALQQDKPPQLQLLNQARMSMAAAAMMAGDLDSAQNALLAINPKTLDDAGKAQHDDLRNLLKDFREQSFSAAFEADTGKGSAVKDKGKAAADEAGKLVELLQKTDPANTAEISQARLKQANALLMGQHYREAEKALKGLNEKQLAPEQKDYLHAIHDEMHAQQIDALSAGYDYDMKHKRFKEAVSTATAMVNDLAKNFPDSKDHLLAARLQQATAQIMNGEMESARGSLGRIDSETLKQMPEGIQKRYRDLSGAVREHFETVKKLEALKVEQAAIEGQLKAIDALTSSGNKADAAKAVPLAEQLLATMQQKHPEAVDNAELTLANARLAAGDIAGAKADLQAIANTTKDPAVKDQAQLLQARAVLKEGQTDKAIGMLRTLSATASTPEVRQAAKNVIISVECGYLKNVERKAGLEQKRLDDIKIEKTPQSGWALLNPFTSVKLVFGKYDRLQEDHNRNLNCLGLVQTGLVVAGAKMNKLGLTLADLQKMSADQLTQLVGKQDVVAVQAALNNPDVQLIARNDFQGKNFSWDKNTWYVDASYLDTDMDKVAHWVGNQVRGARNYDEELKGSDSLFDRAVGYTSGAILDAVSSANSFVKDKIQNASDFYNDPSRKDTWYGKLGRAGTFGGEILTSAFAMPATIVDYKASDAERANAITGTLLMVGTLGVLKSGGPAWASMGNASSRIASTRMAQWVANSEFGQLAGRTASKLGQGAAKLESRFEATGFAKTMDTVKSGLGKLNPEINIGRAKPAPAVAGAGSLEVHPTMPNVMIDSGIPGFDMNKLLRELDRTPGGARIAERIRGGEIEVTVTREPLARGADGMALDNELQVVWGGSIEETASTAIHEGAHVIDPAAMPDGRGVSYASREAIARAEEYEYRQIAGLKPYDGAEQAYRDAFNGAKASGASDIEARLAAEKEMIRVLQADPHYGIGGNGGANPSIKVGDGSPRLISAEELNKQIPQAGNVGGEKRLLNRVERKNANYILDALQDVGKGDASAMNRLSPFRPHQHGSGEFAGWWSVDLVEGNPGEMRIFFRQGQNGFEAKIRQYIHYDK